MSLTTLLYDTPNDRITLIDTDLYVPGPFTNEMGRMLGSSSLMAPEEFERGARIDQDTNVFEFGRLAFLTLGDGSLARGAFRGHDAVFEVASRACTPSRGQRFPTVEAFHEAWRRALHEDGVRSRDRP